MTENEIKLAHYSKCFMTTPLFLTYIKLLSKINTCMGKFTKTQKQIYIEECKNILLTINNSINIYRDNSIILVYIDEPYKERIKQILEFSH